jgi:hypothetical protein
VIDADTMARMPEFSDRMHWFLHRKPHLSGNVARIDESVDRHHHLAAILDEERLRSVLRYLLDEKEFLSPYGIRSLSRHHRADPFETSIDGQRFRVEYAPGESSAALFGGNSNWRGPVWFPINVLLIEALDRFHSHFGDAFEVECPTGSGRMVTLAEVANDIARRLVGLFLVDDRGSRPFAGRRPAAGDALLFHEFFHGDDGRGLGASHQTGWTGSVADLIRRLAHSVAKPTDT